MGQTITFGAADVQPPPPAPPPPSRDASVGTRFAEGAWKNLNPAGLVHAVAHPIDTLGALIDAQVEQIQQAKTLYDQQRYSEAAGHLGAGLLPLVGPPAAKAGERIGSGDIAGGLGEATGLIASLQAPKAVRAVKNTVAARVAALPVGAVSKLAPDVVGLVSPRLAHGAGIVRTIAQVLGGEDVGAAPAGRGTRVPPPADATAPHLDRSVPVQPSALTPAQLAERVLYGRGTPPPPIEKPPIGRVRGVSDVIAPDVAPAGPAASPLDVPAPPAASGAPSAVPPSTPESSSPAPRPTNTLPDQKALNEQALAARRAAYQARQAEAAASDAAAKGQPQPAPARPKLTAAESKEFLRLRKTMTDPQAMDAIQAARDFLKRFGMSTPTPTETKFPKS